MICQGCVVQGFYPHECLKMIDRGETLAAVPCLCDVDPSCNRYAEHLKELAKYSRGVN